VKREERPNGLIIEDLRLGAGAEAQPGGRVKVHYRGTLADGTEFDSSYKRNEPITFSLNGVIAGWQEGIPGLKVGGKRRLTVPAEMGYGRRGIPGTIPPDSTLIFEVELLDLP
jgi:FKBP-type peptidyl-prolyl cis-trans isomerase FkpA